MGNLRKMVVALAGSAALSSCGMNALRVESATSVADLSEALSTEATAILSSAQERRNRAFLSLVASDRSCEYTNPLYIYIPDGSAPPAPATPLCADGEAGPNPVGYIRQPFDVSPLREDALEPTVDLITAAAVYGEALNKIVESPRADVSKTINEALALAQKAHNHATALGLSGLPNLPSISDEQKETAAALLQMIADLAREQRQVRDIRVLYAKHSANLGRYCHEREEDAFGEPCRNSGIYERLARQMDLWVSLVSTGAEQISVNNLQRAYREERDNLTFEARLAFVELIQERASEPGRLVRTRDAMREAISNLSFANDTLGRRLNSPNDEDREAAAAITRQRFLDGLGLVFKALTAWKVI